MKRSAVSESSSPGEDAIMNPLGVKSVAELALCGVAPTLANAIWHATGKRVHALPITRDKFARVSNERSA